MILENEHQKVWQSSVCPSVSKVHIAGTMTAFRIISTDDEPFYPKMGLHFVCTTIQFLLTSQHTFLIFFPWKNTFTWQKIDRDKNEI